MNAKYNYGISKGKVLFSNIKPTIKISNDINQMHNYNELENNSCINYHKICNMHKDTNNVILSNIPKRPKGSFYYPIVSNFNVIYK